MWAVSVLAGAIVQRAIARGEAPASTDPGLVIEALTASIYFRLLLSGEPITTEFVRAVAQLVAVGAGTGGSATLESPAT